MEWSCLQLPWVQLPASPGRCTAQTLLSRCCCCSWRLLLWVQLLECFAMPSEIDSVKRGLLPERLPGVLCATATPSCRPATLIDYWPSVMATISCRHDSRCNTPSRDQVPAAALQVHRLDVDTGGLVGVAKTRLAMQVMSRAFQKRQVRACDRCS